MSLPVFIHPDLSLARIGEPVAIDGAEGRHAVTVKRLAVGEHVAFIDGRGTRVEAEVTEVTGKDLLVGQVTAITEIPEPNPRVVVIQAIPKSERAELAVDLLTQGGADEIIAWQAQRCVARWDEKKAPKARAKWEAAAVSAAKQSRRSRIPQIRGPLTTHQVTQEIAGHPAFVLHEEAEVSLRAAAADGQLDGTVYLIVGPEGGIGQQELDQLRAAGAKALRLGPEVLRTASAGMVALAAIGVLTPRW